VAEWLSEEWAGGVGFLAASLPKAPDVTGTMSLAVGLGGRREVGCHWRYDKGVPGDGGGGKLAEADLQFTVAAADAAGVVSGEITPSVAFMRGRLKATGDGGLLLAFLASTNAPEFDAWRRQVAALADVPGPG
jgi:hypothetical protein